MESKLNQQAVQQLYQMVLSLKTPEECAKFFEDLCTISELQEMSRRMKAAKMLNSGYVYSEIAVQTGLSTATISRVNRCLKYGSDGYIKALENVKKEEKRNK